MRMIAATPRFLPLALLLISVAQPASVPAEPIDREAVVRRHTVNLRELDPWNPLSTGNGRFCFTADVTGLQTFPDAHQAGIPLLTMADWAWHSFPNPDGHELEDALVPVLGGDGKSRPYALGDNSPAGQWLRANPHRYGLATIGLDFARPGGPPLRPEDLKDVDCTLDPWTGRIRSRFTLAGESVETDTIALADADGIAFRIRSPALADAKLGVRVAFPYPSGHWGPHAHDWSKPAAHVSATDADEGATLLVRRTIDDSTGFAILAVHGGSARRSGPHEFRIVSEGGATMEATIVFTGEKPAATRSGDFETEAAASARAMSGFWKKGAAMDFSRSTDPRWRELERRMVLSRYLTAIQSRGDLPPAETGLTALSWHGKFHLEMHWWHSVHFALWGHPDVLERQMRWYVANLATMRANASRQGYRGARWGKMLGPDGRESPSGIGPLLLWQQPHPIYYAELLRRIQPDNPALATLEPLVEETAAFMADFARWNEARKCYELGPPMISAREFGAREHRENRNGAFELAYWRWGLNTANAWRVRRGLSPDESWSRIASQLAPLPIHDGVYIEQEWTRVADGGHPCQLAPCGFLPRDAAIDLPVMNATLDKVLGEWDHGQTWGWDYPLIAMTAARLGRGDDAIRALLFDTPKNHYLANGHNRQTRQLPLYLPGNGGLLSALALMAAGGGGMPPGPNPGFPRDGRWVVSHEGLAPMP